MNHECFQTNSEIYNQDNRSNKAVEIDNAYLMIYYHQQ